jgi:hypothetical protein
LNVCTRRREEERNGKGCYMMEEGRRNEEGKGSGCVEQGKGEKSVGWGRKRRKEEEKEMGSVRERVVLRIGEEPYGWLGEDGVIFS